MLLSLILQTLDAELDRLERIREIVAGLATPSANLVSSAGVAAMLATQVSEPGEAVQEAVQERTQEPKQEPLQAPIQASSEEPSRSSERAVRTASKGPRKARKTTAVASREVGAAPAMNEAELEGAFTNAEETDGRHAAEPDTITPAVTVRTSRKPTAREVVVLSPPKPSMVVISATEAARERASRAARQLAKGVRGEHSAAKPEAPPEELARNLAARWLSGTGPAAELRGR